jgi:hypothetical protein
LTSSTFLEIDHITITSGGSDCNPFIITTGNRLAVHDTTFLSGHGFDAGCNDAIIQGFGGMFLGYGSSIRDNWFWGMGRAYTGNSQPGWEVNGVLIAGNYIQGGNATMPVDAAIKFTGSARGNQVHNNLIELGNSANSHRQTCGIYLASSGTDNSFSGNQAWDGDGTTYLFCGNASAVQNKVDKSNFVDLTGTRLTDPNWSVNNYMPWRTIPFFFDGGGSALSGSTTRCAVVPFGGAVNRFSMLADQSGTATVTVKMVALGSYSGLASANVDITPPTGVTMTNASSLVDTALSGWSFTGINPLPANSAVCVTVSNPSALTWLSGNVQLWEGR